MNRTTAVIMSGCAMLLVTVIGVTTADRPLHTIRIEGVLSAAEQQEVRDAVATVLPASVLRVDLGEVQERIRALSWPRAVTIRRKWPDSLIIRVQKEVAVARWQQGGFVSSSGEILLLPDEKRELPLLDCATATPAEALETYRVLSELTAREQLSIAQLHQNTLGEWTIGMTGGFSVMLGAEQVTERMHRVLLAYRRVVQPHTGVVAAIDARYANGVSIRWQETLVAEHDELAGQQLAAHTTDNESRDAGQSVTRRRERHGG